MNPISVVINTYNEERNIENLLKHLKWADEVIVCDMHSDDKTISIAKKYNTKVFLHNKEGFVEPARNFAISKAKNDWILIIDADEYLSQELVSYLQGLIDNNPQTSFVRIPRKNIIFGKWIKESFWWPDYQIRFFKKGYVTWSNKIHEQPKTEGEEVVLPPEEKFAITHENYQSVSQYISRMDRYTTIQAQELKKEGYSFYWRDIITKPVSEFLTRYFSNQGYKDGLHGLVLSLLQMFSFFIVYLKVWEYQKFEEQSVVLADVKAVYNDQASQIKYWFNHEFYIKNPLKRTLQKIRSKL